MKKTRVLLKDIAREANCSTAAVSRALSADVQQQKLVAPDTFAAIMQAAKKLNYRPSHNKRRALGVVGVFTPLGHSTLSLDLLNGITQAANEAHTPLYCYNYQDGSSFVDFMNNHISQHRAMGVVSYYPPAISEVPEFMAMYEKLKHLDIPLVIIHNDAPDDFKEITVKFDNYYGGSLAGKHLRELKCREYYILGSGVAKTTPAKHYSFERLQGCYNELTFHLRTTCHMLTNNMGYGVDVKHGIIEMMYRMVDWRQPGAVGIFCDCDRLAAHLMTFLQSKQINIGSQAKIVGYNGEEFTGNLYPSLTTVKQNFHQLGFIAMQKLFNMMRGKSESSLTIKPELIVRSST